MTQQNKTLGEFIINKQSEFKYSSGELTRLINSIRLAGKIVNHEVNKAGLVDILGTAGEENIQGEEQQKLDIFANETFIKALKNLMIVLEQVKESLLTLKDWMKIIIVNMYLLMDPLDGSSNIDVNVSVGTIFSIYRRITPVGTPVTIEDFLQPGKNQVAAGYIVYGTSTMIVYSTGHGVNGFTLNPAIGTYYLSHPNMRKRKHLLCK